VCGRAWSGNRRTKPITAVSERFGSFAVMNVDYRMPLWWFLYATAPLSVFIQLLAIFGFGVAVVLVKNASEMNLTINRERGTVRSWNHTEGTGRIQSDAGDTLWAHFSFILQQAGYRGLTAGQRVEFTRFVAPAGPLTERLQAHDVVSV
jgi:cold shock CspA family protein